MKDIYELLVAKNLLAYLVVAGSMIVAISRGGFALSIARRKSRHELIEFWCVGDKGDDFWLETVVRHGFGGFLPAHAIRDVLRMRSPALKLLKVSQSWAYLEYDYSTGVITWKRRWRSKSVWKWTERTAVAIGYVFFAAVAMYFFQLDGGLLRYLLVAYFLLISALCLFKLVDLVGAETAVRLVS